MSTGIIKKYTCDGDVNPVCVKKLSSLSLRRLIMPTNIKLTRKNGVRSYSLELPQRDEEPYSELDKRLLVNEIRTVRADFSKLSDASLIFEKLTPDNVIVSGRRIFIYDYKKLTNPLDIDYARTYNNVAINELFGHRMLIADYPNRATFNTIDKFYTDFLLTTHENLEDYIEAEVKEESLAKHLAKRY